MSSSDEEAACAQAHGSCLGCRDTVKLRVWVCAWQRGNETLSMETQLAWEAQSGPARVLRFTLSSLFLSAGSHTLSLALILNYPLHPPTYTQSSSKSSSISISGSSPDCPCQASLLQQGHCPDLDREQHLSGPKWVPRWCHLAHWVSRQPSPHCFSGHHG